MTTIWINAPTANRPKPQPTMRGHFPINPAANKPKAAMPTTDRGMYTNARRPTSEDVPSRSRLPHQPKNVAMNNGVITQQRMASGILSGDKVNRSS